MLSKKLSLITTTFSLIVLFSCQDGSEHLNEEIKKEQEIVRIKEKLERLNFHTSEGFYEFEDGYIVEYDIYLTEAKIDELINQNNTKNTAPAAKIAGVKHYVTNNLVTNQQTLKIFMDPDFDTYMQNSFNAALDRYNAVDIGLRFERTDNQNDADISISGFYSNANILGYASGFPSDGMPNPTIRLNTRYYYQGTSRRDAVSVIAHEIGHTIGFRHTDFMNRGFSCNSDSNEGDAGVGANHVSNTPTGPEANSWMLACSNNTDRPFTSNDITALENTYPYYDPFTIGWNNTNHVRTVADVNGDGKGDIVGFGDNHVFVSLSNGNGFEPKTIWNSEYTNGWNNTNHVRRVADVNGDGKADIIGFGYSHVPVALSNGSSFGPQVRWNYEYTNGWNTTEHERVVADVNGDGKADIVGFGYNHVPVALSNGSSFGSQVRWNYEYTIGWNNNEHVRTVADVNGDGKADIIGFGYSHVPVALSNGSTFGPQVRWNYEYTIGWNNTNHVRTVADVNGDGKADIIGFGNSHVYVSLSNGSSFGPQQRWNSEYTTGWNNNEHVRTVADVNGDGKADIIGFGYEHVLVSLSTGTSFGPQIRWFAN